MMQDSEHLAVQRDNLFFPPWAFGLPGSILRLPYSLTEAIIYVRHPCLGPASLRTPPLQDALQETLFHMLHIACRCHSCLAVQDHCNVRVAWASWQ